MAEGEQPVWAPRTLLKVASVGRQRPGCGLGKSACRLWVFCVIGSGNQGWRAAVDVVLPSSGLVDDIVMCILL